jgi:hypothetical protein
VSEPQVAENQAHDLWHLDGRNMIDWFEDRGVALQAVRAYLDADEADLVALIIRDAAGTIVMSATGAALIEWADTVGAQIGQTV